MYRNKKYTAWKAWKEKEIKIPKYKYIYWNLKILSFNSNLNKI